MSNIMLRLSLSALLAFMLSACQPASQAKAPPAKRPAPEVGVAKVLYEQISDWDEFTGRLEAPETIQIKPRVSGYVEKVAFKEGSLVKKGQLLFKIDDRTFKAEVRRLQAQLTSAEAQLGLSERDVARAKSLLKKRALSEEVLDNRETQLAQAQAQVEAIKAQLIKARLDLDFTAIKAEINGKVSRALITAGNYVEKGKAVLTTLVSSDRIYAYFDVDERAYLNYMAAHRGQPKPELNVFMRLTNEDSYLHTGKIDFVDNRVNAQTGTLRVRAVFDNADNLFTPGLFARLKVIKKRYQDIVINDRAIGTDLNNRFVLVLGEDNKVQYRPVILGPKINGLRVIRSGLKQDEVIVVDGLQRIRPGAQVNPKQQDMATPAVLQKFHQNQSFVDQALQDSMSPQPDTKSLQLDDTAKQAQIDSRPATSSKHGA